MTARRRWGSFVGLLGLIVAITWPATPLRLSAEDGDAKKPSADKKEKTDKKSKKDPPEVVIEFGPEDDADDKGKAAAKKAAPSKKGKTPAKDPKKSPAKKPAEGKPADDKPADSADDETPAKGKSKSKSKKAKSAEVPEFVGAPDNVCKVCLDTGFVPLATRRPYVHVEGDRAPSPATCVPWRLCPRCRQDHDADKLVGVESERLQSAGQSNLFWEGRTGLKLVRVESRHIAHHCDLPVDMARRQGQAAETIAAYLQKQTQSVYLTQSRPAKYEHLFVWDRAKYLKMIEVCKTVDEFKGVGDWHLLTQCAGFNGAITAISNAEKGDPLPPEHSTISRFGLRNLLEATGGKAGDWLRYGFAYCSEYSILNTVRVHYIDYQVNETRLADDWMAEARRHAQMQKIRKWEEMTRIPLQNWSSIEHLSAFAYVAYLFRTDPRKFCLMSLAIREGQGEVQAMESVYGKPIDELQKACYKWLGAK